MDSSSLPAAGRRRGWHMVSNWIVSTQTTPWRCAHQGHSRRQPSATGASHVGLRRERAVQPDCRSALGAPRRERGEHIPASNAFFGRAFHGDATGKIPWPSATRAAPRAPHAVRRLQQLTFWLDRGARGPDRQQTGSAASGTSILVVPLVLIAMRGKRDQLRNPPRSSPWSRRASIFGCAKFSVADEIAGCISAPPPTDSEGRARARAERHNWLNGGASRHARRIRNLKRCISGWLRICPTDYNVSAYAFTRSLDPASDDIQAAGASSTAPAFSHGVTYRHSPNRASEAPLRPEVR